MSVAPEADIEALSAALGSAGLPAQVVAARLEGARGMALTLVCGDWQDGPLARRFELRCERVRDAGLTVGCSGELAFDVAHPLLERHRGPQGALYVWSKPAIPEQVLYVARERLDERYRPWFRGDALLAGPTDELVAVLSAGRGALAEGPLAAMHLLAEQLEPLLELTVVGTTRLPETARLLRIGAGWVVCERVSIEELAA